MYRTFTVHAGKFNPYPWPLLCCPVLTIFPEIIEIWIRPFFFIGILVEIDPPSAICWLFIPVTQCRVDMLFTPAQLSIHGACLTGYEGTYRSYHTDEWYSLYPKKPIPKQRA